MAPTRPLGLKKSNSLELPNANVLSLEAHNMLCECFCTL